jgi:hypothetical protein
MFASVILPLPESDLKTELSLPVNDSNTGLYPKKCSFSNNQPRNTPSLINKELYESHGPFARVKIHSQTTGNRQSDRAQHYRTF